MFKIAIIDDEIHIRERIETLVHKTLINEKIDYLLYCHNNGTEFLNSSHNDVDLIFLDIEMGKENGIEISKYFKEIGMNAIVVFVTSFEGYVRNAFGLNVFAFITKEEMEERVPITLKQIINDLNKKAYTIVNTEFGPVTVNFSDVLYFMIDDRKCFLSLKKEKDLIRFFATTLKGVKNDLDDRFLQPNAKYIINAEHVNSIENGVIILDNDDCLFISKGKVRKFMDMYRNYLISKAKK